MSERGQQRSSRRLGANSFLLAIGDTVLPWALGTVLYVAFVTSHSVNVPFSDDWSLIALLKADSAHRLTLGLLWAQHNENRIIVPELIFLWVAHHFRNFESTMMLISALTLAIGNLFFLVAIRLRTSTKGATSFVVALASSCLITATLYSLASIENDLWAFQYAWFLIYALSALAILTVTLMGRRGFHPLVTVASLVVISVVASLSSAQGLFVWIAEIAALITYALAEAEPSARRNLWRIVGALSTGAIVTVVVYFWNLNLTRISPPVAGSHFGPAYILSYFETVATSASFGLSGHGSAVARDVVLGLYLLVILGVGTRFALSKKLPDPIVVYSVIFASIFELSVTESRYQLGLLQGASSRYALYFFPAISVLPYLAQGWTSAWSRPGRDSGSPKRIFQLDSVQNSLSKAPQWRGVTIRLLILFMAGFMVYRVDTRFGVPAAAVIKGERRAAVTQISNFPKWNVSKVDQLLYPNAAYLEQLVPFYKGYESSFKQGGPKN